MRVAGAVLAGGRSVRMGRTKALVELDGRAMADRVIDALRAAGCSPVVIYGGDAAELAVLGAPVEADRFPGEGPVGGMIGALDLLTDRRATGGEAPDGVVVVPCDVPDLTVEVVAALVVAAESNAAADVVVGRTDRREPLCGLWRRSALGGLQAAFDEGERALHVALERLRVAEVAVPIEALRNVNTPDDLGGG